MLEWVSVRTRAPGNLNTQSQRFVPSCQSCHMKWTLSHSFSLFISLTQTHSLPISLSYFLPLPLSMRMGPRTGNNQNDLHTFDPATATWEVVSPIGDLPAGRRDFCSAEMDGKLYVHGSRPSRLSWPGGRQHHLGTWMES